MTASIIINWDYVPGSLSTTVEYKLQSSSTWITPSSPPNPTSSNHYAIDLVQGEYYDIRLTTNGISCGPRSTTIQYIVPVTAQCCPPTYTMSLDGTYCYKVNTTTATPPSGAENASAVSNTHYSVFGTVIMDPGYGVNGVGSFTQIPYSNPFWVNGPGYPTSTGTTSAGPQNRSGVWSSTLAVPQDVGFTVCINITEEGVYYMGIGCDDYAIIRLDGTTVIQQDLVALQTYFVAHGYPLSDAPSMGLHFWYIYPITLTAGNHILELVGHNSIGTAPGSASIGCEIYKLTPTQIAAATSYVDLGAGLLFSSKNYVGQPIQIGSGGVGYTCPPTYSLVLCDGPAYCSQTITTPTIDC